MRPEATPRVDRSRSTVVASTSTLVLLAIAAASLWLGWVDGFDAHQAITLRQHLERLGIDLDLGIIGVRLDPTVIEQLDPEAYVSLPGWSLGALGPWILAVSVVGMVLTFLGTATKRPLVHLVTAGALSTVATLGVMLVVAVEWVDLRSMPFADRLPLAVRELLPDLHAGVGMWV